MGIFKAYDIRGVYPDELNDDLAAEIGSAIAAVFHPASVVIGRDVRSSSEPLAAALIRSLLAAGADVLDIGCCTTPMCYFAVGHLKRDFGVMVTASHNPARYNGFKLCRGKAIPVSYDTGISEIERLVRDGVPPPSPSQQPGTLQKSSVLHPYRNHVRSFLRLQRPLRIVVDAANGCAGPVFNEVFDGTDIEVEHLFFEPDGSFPHHEPNPLKDENIRDLTAAVRRLAPDLGVAFDGDADRCMFLDETGRRIPSDLLTALVATDFLSRERGAAIVFDLRSSRVVPEEITKAGGVPVRERVGHSFIKATMREHKAVFGGELSGHYYFRDNFFADSGLIILARVLDILSGSDRPISRLIAPLRRYHATGEINFIVEDKKKCLAAIENSFPDGRLSHLDGLTVEFDDWWCNVRESNTEPLLRLNLEAHNPGRMAEMRDRIVSLLGTPLKG